MRIGRTLPPSVAPVTVKNIFTGMIALFKGQKEIHRFEKELKAYFDIEHVYLLSSGKAALTVILKALHKLHPDRDEVLIPAFTCFSVPSAIIRAGLKVRLCDSAENSFDFNYDQLENIIKDDGISKEKLLAIVPTHLYGYPSNIKRLKKIINQEEVSIIEDAAQAMGSVFDGVKCGTAGDVGFFSLSRGKTLTAIEGGIIITNNDYIDSKIKKIIGEMDTYTVKSVCSLIIYAIVLLLFTRPSLFWLPKSMPFLGLGRTVFDTGFKILKMSAFQAGFVLGWENRLSKILSIKKEIFEKYKKKLEQKSKSGVGLYDYEKKDDKPIAPIRFPLRVKNEQNRDEILKESEKYGLGIMGSYPESINQLNIPVSCLESYQYKFSEMHAKEMITLPLHSYVTDKDIAKISKLF